MKRKAKKLNKGKTEQKQKSRKKPKYHEIKVG